MSRREVEKKLKLRAVLTGLRKMYGNVAVPRFKPGAGLDMLIEAMLSQNTNMINAHRGYRMLRRRFKSWTAVMNAEVGDVQREIAICGLARMRARRLQALLRTIKAGQGRVSIDFLANERVEAAMEFLLGFFGIGPKTAAFTLLFGLGHPVLPVDNGVLRVVRRLRLVRAKARDLEAERVLSPLIARGKHYPMHVLLFRHAKERCRVKNPTCGECKLLKICPHGRRVVRHRPPGGRGGCGGSATAKTTAGGVCFSGAREARGGGAHSSWCEETERLKDGKGRQGCLPQQRQSALSRNDLPDRLRAFDADKLLIQPTLKIGEAIGIEA